MNVHEAVMARVIESSGWKLTFMVDSMNKKSFFRAETETSVITAVRMEELFDQWSEHPEVLESVFKMKKYP